MGRGADLENIRELAPHSRGSVAKATITFDEQFARSAKVNA
jgi:hypothetical protein